MVRHQGEAPNAERAPAESRRAPALFGPVTLSRREAVGAAAAAAAVGSLAAVALSDGTGQVSLSGPVTPGAGQTPEPSSAAGGDGLTGGGSVAPASTGPSAAGNTTTTAALSPVALATNLDPEHLMRRVTYGATATMRADMDRLGPERWLATQLAPSTIKDPLGDKVGAMYPRLAWSSQRVHAMRGQNEEYYSRWMKASNSSATCRKRTITSNTIRPMMRLKRLSRQVYFKW